MASITKEQVEEISTLQKSAGRKKLKEFLQWEDFDEEDNFQKSIYLDYLYDTIQFTIKKGFPWAHATLIFRLAVDILEESKGKSLTETIKLYKTKCQECEKIIDENYLKTYTDYFFSTYLQHHKLYQCVFTKEQDRCNVNINLTVETPPPSTQFSEGKSVNIWEYEKKLEEIDEKGKNRKQERREDSLLTRADDQQQLEKAYSKVSESDVPLQKEHLTMLISEVTQAHLTAATHQLQSSIDNTLDDLELMLEKTCLPRPPELGPPPRYRTKTPTSSITGTRKKSAKERKSSSRASKKR